MVDTKAVEANETVWHVLTAEECLGRLNSLSERGLSAEEAAKRLAEFGPNALTPKKGKPAWLRFLEQFNQPLVYILLAAAIVTFFLHEWVDSAVIFLVVFVNAIVGYLQEAKALKALDALSLSMITHAVVFRGGKKTTIPSSELVPGDIVFLASGDKVPADMRLIKGRELQADESALTGESLPVQKSTAAIASGTVLADRVNMLYASSLVTYGQGTAVVVETGSRTEVGRISELISSAESLATPLTKKIAQFSRFLLYIILGMAALTFFAGVLRGQPAVDMFMAAVALAVGAIPEGLPAVVTITLAIGVSRMASRRAIIRKLPAVETLGSTMIICSDKTGTLTENQMTVQKLFAGFVEYDLTGDGYSPKGEILFAGKQAALTESSASKECLLAGLLCNDGALVEKNGRFEIEGDPTEGALLVSAAKAGFPWRGENVMPRLDCIPFESQHQYMATVHEAREDSERLIYMKGAVEKVLDRCRTFLDESGQERPFDNKEKILAQVSSMASRGLRVLAFARKKISSLKTSISHGDLDGMTFLGLQGMMDPPRQEAIRAVQNCHRAGITVKMITGDHVLTAAAIAKQLNLKREPGAGEEEALLAVTGKEMEGFSDAQFEDIAVRATVFARVTPEQKLRLVKALQARGNVVAMTGDGVNDAPALKQANIGVAMGRGGTEAAKEASDMVLTDDNFATIEAAVEEGRCVFSNLRKFIIWSLPTNLGEGLSILAAVLAGTALPILPVQILWINMTTAVCLGMMLAFEPKEPDIMSRPPRNPKAPIMTRGIVKRTLYVGLLLVAGVFGLFLYERRILGASLEEARTVASTMLVMGELFYLFNCRSLTKSAFSIGFFTNKLALAGTAVMLALQALFIYTPVMNALFQSAPLDGGSWLRILGAGLFIYLIVEAEKHLRKRRGSLGKAA